MKNPRKPFISHSLFLQILFAVFSLALIVTAGCLRIPEWVLTCLGLILAAGLSFMLIRINKAKKNDAEERIQSLMDILPTGVRIISFDDNTLMYSNKACMELFGCKSFEEQVEGQNGLKFMPEIQPDGRKTIDLVAEIIQKDEVAAEFQCLKLDGTPFTCHMTSRIINYKGHRASLGVMEDITAEEEYEKRLRNAVLKEREANQAKSRFLAMMSHEIRTPMNVILGISEIELQKDVLSEETGEALNKIYESGTLLMNIINDILDLSKIESGKLEIASDEFEIPSLINDVMQSNRLFYDSKPIKFELNIEENTPLKLFGDELRIKQVLGNILSNAFKYTQKGKVTLSISCEPYRPVESLPPENGSAKSENVKPEADVMLIFCVHDTGRGMTEDQLDRLFDEYARFDIETNCEIVGTGLGMTITKRILDLMNGKIHVRSERGAGSTFTAYIPQKRIDDSVCGSQAAEKLQNFSFRSTEITKKTQFPREYMPHGSVLVVDDMESNTYVAKGMLLPYGINVETAVSGFEAIEKIKNGKTYDIIFMDHMMPKMNGIVATEVMRDLLEYKGCIIALTANTMAGHAEMFLENGFDGYISKPIDSRELDLVLGKFICGKKPPETESKTSQSKQPRQTGKSGNKTDAIPEEDEMTDENENTVRKLTEMEEFFLIDAKRGIAEIKRMRAHTGEDTLNEADTETYEITVHGLKSALANIGELELSGQAYRLEKAGVEHDFAVIKKETPAFINALESLVSKLEPLSEGIPENNINFN